MKLAEALKKYVSHKQHSGSVSSCDFVVDQTSPGWGPALIFSSMIQLSPPLLVLERNETIDEVCEDKTFFLSKVEGKVLLKTNHKYYFQVQEILGILQLKCIARNWRHALDHNHMR